MRIGFLAAGLMALAPMAAAAPQVATDIAPVASLAARVMAGVGVPVAILPPGASPHGYAMRPSEAEALQAADLVFWVGPGLTPWFGEAVAAVAPDARSVILRDAPGVVLLPMRTGATFEAHDHAAEGAHDHDGDHAADAAHDHDKDHAAEAAHDHDKDHAAEAAHDHDSDHAADAAHDHDKDHAAEAAHDHAADSAHDDHAHAEGAVDEHLWLDPANARAWAAAMAAALSAADPENEPAYIANAAALIAEMNALEDELRATLAPAANRPFIVFHDAYQYFENRFGLAAAGAISPGDATTPGAARVAEVRALAQQVGAVCVLSEPQFSPALVRVVIEGTEARAATLDPLGAALKPGPDLYAGVLRGIAATLRDCLGD